jgi:hypothetical protein
MYRGSSLIRNTDPIRIYAYGYSKVLRRGSFS